MFLVAKFEHKIIDIKFNLDGGSGISEKKIEAGKPLAKPDDPTKFGYNFVGWYLLGKEYNFNSIVEKDLTLVAKWEPISYVTVKFDTDGAEEIKSQVIESGHTIKKPVDPIKEGYTFKHWSYNEEEFNFDTEITQNITLKAIYEKNK